MSRAFSELCESSFCSGPVSQRVAIEPNVSSLPIHYGARWHQSRWSMGFTKPRVGTHTTWTGATLNSGA